MKVKKIDFVRDRRWFLWLSIIFCLQSAYDQQKIERNHKKWGSQHSVGVFFIEVTIRMKTHAKIAIHYTCIVPLQFKNPQLHYNVAEWGEIWREAKCHKSFKRHFARWVKSPATIRSRIVTPDSLFIAYSSAPPSSILIFCHTYYLRNLLSYLFAFPSPDGEFRPEQWLI